MRLFEPNDLSMVYEHSTSLSNQGTIIYFISLQELGSWQYGSPLVYQKYNHHYYNKETPLYTCYMEGGLYYWRNICLDLSPLKESAQTRTHALTSKHEACTIMLLSNLAEPEWISIPCNRKFLYFVFCTKKNKLNYLHCQNVTNNITVKSCEHFQITIMKDCYSFIWLTNKSIRSRSYMDIL